MTTILIVLALPFFGEASPTAVGASSPASQAPVTVRGRVLASEVRTLLRLKCAECHGAKLARPKGKFGHVEDLKRVAGNPKLVVPFQPDKSKLWQLIRDNGMPPKRAKAGPLKAEQKDDVRDWIESGAASTGDVPASAAIMSATHTGEDVVTEGMDVPFIEHLLGWLGKFHVIVVHFPIALLVVAAAGELLSLWRGTWYPAPAVRFCVLFAAAGAVAATTLGWLHAAFSAYAASSSQVLALHRWTGSTAGILAVGVAILSEVEVRRGVRSPLFRVLLFAGTLLVSVAGHLGGTLVYGDSYFDW
jgi:uncharacterized membrane protein